MHREPVPFDAAGGDGRYSIWRLKQRRTTLIWKSPGALPSPPAQRVEPRRLRGYKTLKQMIKVHLKLTQVGTEAEKTEAVASVVASFQQLMAIVSSNEGSH
jgi:hypothetical protein